MKIVKKFDLIITPLLKTARPLLNTYQTCATETPLVYLPHILKDDNPRYETPCDMRRERTVHFLKP